MKIIRVMKNNFGEVKFDTFQIIVESITRQMINRKQPRKL